MMRLMAAILAVVVMAGCEGAEGPTGPQGPAGADGLPGPAGPDGTANKLVITVTTDADGVAVAELPVEVGTDPEDIPLMACYLRNPDFGIWYMVADGFSDATAWCQVSFEEDNWVASILQAPEAWPAAFVVVY